MTIQRALLSVSDKTGIVELATFLHKKNVELLSTGGTAALLKKHHIPVVDVAAFTNSPEMMGGRVKTLHPKIHGGILSRQSIDEDEMAQFDIRTIDCVVVNLYPFERTIASPECAFSDAIENIDIGGPTMIRAAAKNHQEVIVLVAASDYATLQTRFETIDEALRFELAKKAFAHTAHYDAAISNYLGTLNAEHKPGSFPSTLTCQFHQKQSLRYGENPHQAAMFYTDASPPKGSISSARQCQGKDLSYNNIADADAALQCVKEFDEDESTCVIVKHANPCGIATRATQLASYLRAFQTDETSSFGGIIAFNQTLKAQTAQAILDNQFVEVLIAPKIDNEALSILATKKNIRVLETDEWDTSNFGLDFKRVTGGLLVQEADVHRTNQDQLKIVTNKKPTAEQMQDLLFAFKAAKHVKSNAIVYAKNQATLGVGAGQMSRVYSAVIAGIKAVDANLSLQGAVMASDAFFPFRDAIDKAQEAGISAIIQPGGSIRDDEVIEAANEAGIAMVFTAIRHFKH